MTYYTIYQITNKINGKIYIGSHKTRNLDDGYMGSGKYLVHAINKHGLDNFTKEILFVFDNPEDMYAKEAELVNEDFLAEANTYNLKQGGFGGWDYINRNQLNNTNKDMPVIGAKISASLQGKPRLDISASMKQQYANGRKPAGCFSPEGRQIQIQKTWTQKARAKRAKSRKRIRFQQGENNSQYNTMWIVNERLQKNRRISKFDDIPEGWRKGRVLDFNRLNKKRLLKKRQKTKTSKIKNKRIQQLREIMHYYRDNDISMRELSKMFGVGHNVYVSFNRYFYDEYSIIAKEKLEKRTNKNNKK